MNMQVTVHGIHVSIHFMWDMSGDDMPVTGSMKSSDASDYIGAVYFGNYKLEFIRDNCPEGYRNLFQYDKEGYGWLPDGTPYDELDCADEITIPHRRTFSAFAQHIEKQILLMLDRHPLMIVHAIKPTEPAKWYTGWKTPYARTITREV